MRKRLTGKEEGLAGLWNFEDGTARDASGNARHGTLFGNARVVTTDPAAASLLVASETPPKPAPPANALATVPANGRDAAGWWIAGALTLIVGLLAWLVVMLRRSGIGGSQLLPAASAHALLPESDALANQDLKELALAELTEFAKQSLVQGLYSQRNALLETHQKAQQELAELEARLVSLHLSDRVQAYEQHIGELEKQLETRSGEVRELTTATLLLLRRKLEEEKQLEHKTSRFN
jgi:hypothetical protein